MKQPETLFKEKVQRRLRQEFGERIWFFKSSERSIRGIPDIIGCLNGFFFAMELKVDARLDKLQGHTLRRVRGAGGIAMVTTPKTLNDCIERLKQEDFDDFESIETADTQP